MLVRGPRARVVPVLSRYHDVLRASAQFAHHQFVVGGEELTRHNVTSRLVSSLAGGEDVARLSIHRLRSTWLVAVAELTGLKILMDAAGITCSQHLGDVVKLCRTASEAASISALGGLGAI